MLEFAPALSAALRAQDAPVIVTGVGGWLGQAAAEMAAAALGEAAPTRLLLFGRKAGEWRGRGGGTLKIRPLAALETLAAPGTLLFHCAFLTREHAGTPGYVAANDAIFAQLRNFIRRQPPLGMFLPSSGAVYATDENPYGRLKRRDEAAFAALADELGFPLATIRVFNLAGPFINKLDSYALACIVRDVLAGGPVRLRAAHPVWRGYTHVGDVLNVALGAMRQAGLAPFDSGGEPVELAQLAERAGRVLVGRVPDILRPPPSGSADRYLGDGAMFARQAARLGGELKTLDAQILETGDYLRGLSR